MLDGGWSRMQLQSGGLALELRGLPTKQVWYTSILQIETAFSIEDMMLIRRA